jgi:tetratricopeptide (TPR) repeat protein
MSLATLPVEQILRIPFPSYHKPLESARQFTRSSEPDDQKKAVELFSGLNERYPHVLAVGQERVLALMESGDPDEAEQVLKGLEKLFIILDEETLCRWGRLFKDRGDEYIGLPWSKAVDREADPVLASQFYRKSLEKYEQAYRIRSGHYPGINTATLWLILGSLEAQPPGAATQDEVHKSQERAGELLACRSRWPSEQPDDESVWHPATAGEAHLLRQEWEDAAKQYREALKGKNVTSLARRSMSRQAERILLCFRILDVPIPAPWEHLESLFETGSPSRTGAVSVAPASQDSPDPGPLSPS